ncbi:uncharacterized protein J4E92_006317 [Alternaria infectoria]|uniref:uncharacterized protein n=1 Tax=Alternaria infectoria TaxID=45303 RepID=UPI00221F53F3|nr:uncharacterized protein J4E92_006317 [Alternaria infectoria]KAI4927152.1 hypothetical protein J4E92_006317 [Alternaria infectoria]
MLQDVSDLPDIDKSIEKRKTAKTSSASSASIASFGSSIGRRFSFKSFSSRKPTTKVEKPRNEFGLNTVYEPDETSAVIADLVFVHGLGGGSSTTWCLKQDADYFWPKEWLPKDPDFKGVRIHSFGYNANWATWLKSPVDIHAFGQSLVEDLRSDPKINNLDSRIILVGHSMGGLVIKKACVLSKTNPDYSDIANRLHSLYFLGTPHRGSNLAGYAEERIQLLNANHRDLAKFETTLDSNYRSLRNRLASTIDQIRLEMQKQTTPSNFSSMGIGIKTPDASVLRSLPELYQSRANEMEEIANFREWRSPPAPRYFWLKGTPASGKSMLASYVIEFLQDSPVCHYFFNKGDKTDNNVSSFLRSMALQMAQINPVVRSAIFRLSQKGPPIDARNQRTIWNTVFTSCVFHVTFPTPHYWVVDALDEAADRGTLNECFSLLSKIDENIPLKIFVTSRPDPALDDLFVQLPLVQEYISPEDLLPDISSISDGSPLHQVPWIDAFSEDTDSGFAPSPSAARLSTEQQTLAIVYRSKPVQLWSLDKQHRIGACLRPATHRNDKGGHTVNCVVFNTSSANPRLLVSYWDDILVKFDSRTCKPLLTTATCVTKIAMSCNEKTFAGSDGNGGIKIFDFETLQPLHNIHIQGDPVSSLAFTSDSLRIVDSRGTQANVWEPLVLFGQDTEALSSEPSESVHQIVDDIVESVVNESAIITTLHCCDQSGMAFCGRNDGRVDTCNLDDPENTMRNLYKHGGSFISITCMDWSPRARVIASADSAGKFCIMKITTGTRREWSAEMMVQSRLGQGCIIRQILVHPEGSFVLVSSSEADSIWSLSTKEQVASLDRRERISWKWFVRPSAPSQLLLFEDKILRLFRWEDLHQIAASENPVVPIEMERRMSGEQADADAISVSSEGDDLVILQRSQTVQQSVPGLRPQSNDVMMTKIRVFDLTTLDPESTDIGGSSSPDMSIDSAAQSLVFLNPKPSSTLGIPLSPTATPNVPFTYPFGGVRSKSYTRWSSIRDVADIPDVERIIGTVKKFDWWHLIFLSKMGWVCSVQIGEGGRKVLDQFQKHFFVPSVWRTGNSPLIAKVRRSHDIVIVHQDGVIVVKNGLDNGEHVSFSLSTL